MSVKVMGLVWDLKISREEKFILLAYADHADHEGGSIFPAISTIAEKTGYSERSVQRITRKLETSGYLVAVSGQKGGVGITAHWCIPMKGDKIAPIPKGDNNGSERVTPATPKGDIAVSPDPSLTVNEPSIDNIEQIGGAGFYIFSLVGYDFDDADSSTKAGLAQLIDKHGEYKLCVMADEYKEEEPDIDLRSLLARIADNVDTYTVKDKDETAKETYY